MAQCHDLADALAERSLADDASVHEGASVVGIRRDPVCGGRAVEVAILAVSPSPSCRTSEGDDAVVRAPAGYICSIAAVATPNGSQVLVASRSWPHRR